LESGGCDVVGDGISEGGEGSLEGQGCGCRVGFEEGDEEPALELGVEDGDADAPGVRV
jgi:hypothetical protein